jgi:hypothetical protein
VPSGGSGVEGLVQGAEADAAAAQVRDDSDQVLVPDQSAALADIVNAHWVDRWS